VSDVDLRHVRSTKLGLPRLTRRIVATPTDRQHRQNDDYDYRKPDGTFAEVTRVTIPAYS
jgi:hypothetical protein